MHMRGEPTNMNQLDQYTNVTEDVMYELEQRLDQALEMGIKNTISSLILVLVYLKCSTELSITKRVLETESLGISFAIWFI